MENNKQNKNLVDTISFGILKLELFLLPVITVACLFKLATSFSSFM